MIKILKAIYGNSLDVKNIVEQYIINDKINFVVNNDTFKNDPLPHIVKKLNLEIDYNGEIFKYNVSEGENFYFPKKQYVTENSLILTSCNRIEQVLLAIAVNKEIIKEDFNLVVVDCSTSELEASDAVRLHNSDDPYNLINEKNYNSNYTLIESYVNTISKIKKFSLIHVSPRLNKQMGEAYMTSLGLNAASLLGSKHAVKLTGVCQLKYDIFSKLDEYLNDKYITTWKRTNFNNKSTRIFACNPTELNKILITSGFFGWIYEYNFIESKFENIIDENMISDKINHMSIDEKDILVDEGVGRNDHREIIYNNLVKYNLQNSNDIWIKKFLDGKIW